ncbi:MAG: FkbM family methyltransferase [Synergistaceae bacterium]|jgi:FkbM family methyltransferase|nr:FkbM family methyltransferase [Synergistaceae bacterium]
MSACVIRRKLAAARKVLSNFSHRGATPWELFLAIFDLAAVNVVGHNPGFYQKACNRRKAKFLRAWPLETRRIVKDGAYVIKDVRLPLLDRANEETLFNFGWGDTFLVYSEFGDRYDESLIGDLFDKLAEGPYCLRNDTVDVTVEPGDVVIDAGSWIGDFAAYASVKGASKIYAFEPTAETFEYLLKTAAMNPNIHPVMAGLGDVKTESRFFAGKNNPASSTNSALAGRVNGGEERTVSITTIDDFVRENGLTRVDFIKADIEGYERNMLIGARETLRRFAPKLALCTYHLLDDPEVLEGIIKESNPAYRVVQKAMKLFASVAPP